VITVYKQHEVFVLRFLSLKSERKIAKDGETAVVQGSIKLPAFAEYDGALLFRKDQYWMYCKG
jgi:hypothetical protein